MILIHYSKSQHEEKEKQSSEKKKKKSRLYTIIARFLLHG